MTTAAADPNIYRGARIGTPIPSTVSAYCRDDNTLTSLPISLRARACRLEWRPAPRQSFGPDLFAELFGEAA